MTKLNEFLKNTELADFKRIEDFDEIIVADLDPVEKEATKKDGETFTYYAVEIGGNEIRIPKTVLKQLKTQLAAKSFDKFKVEKSGDGLNTEYTVITL